MNDAINDIVSSIHVLSFRRLIQAVWDEVPDVIKYLQDEYGINPVIIGGLAVQHWGVVRMTEDLDLLISKADYDKLQKDGKIQYGSLKFKPGYQVDIVYEGRDGNPGPNAVRDGITHFPTLAGLLYLKLIAGRMKDQSDIVELLKANGMPDIDKAVMSCGSLNKAKQDLFRSLYAMAAEESKKGEKDGDNPL